MADKITNYKQAIEELEQILDQIENNEPDIDNLAEKVKRASELLTICKNKLYKTEEEVEKILKKIDSEE